MEHGVTGWLTEPGNVDGIAAAVQLLADDPVARRQMGQRARQRVLDRFDLDRSVQATAALLMRLAGEHAPRRDIVDAAAANDRLDRAPPEAARMGD